MSTIGEAIRVAARQVAPLACVAAFLAALSAAVSTNAHARHVDMSTHASRVESPEGPTRAL